MVNRRCHHSPFTIYYSLFTSLDAREAIHRVGVARGLEAALDEGVEEAVLVVAVLLDAALRLALEGLVGDEVHGLGRVLRALVLEDDLQDRPLVVRGELLRVDELRRDEEDRDAAARDV